MNAAERQKATQAREAAVAWRVRAEAAAEEIRTRIGLRLFASAAYGGMTLSLDDAEAWLQGRQEEER